MIQIKSIRLVAISVGIFGGLLMSEGSVHAQNPQTPHVAPSRQIPQVAPSLPSLTDLPTHHRKILWASPHDQPKTRRRHYYKTNESRHDLFRPYVLNIRGGYIGIASSQNYNMIAWAGSEFAWLIDFDNGIQDIHSIHRAFILHAPDTARFLSHWDPRHRQQSVALLHKVYRKHAHKQRIIRIFERFQQRMYQHLFSLHRWPLRQTSLNWLNHPPSYRYIRRMYQTDRIRILFGDLLGSQTLQGIGAAARQINMPIRVLYLSNAEEWFSYRPSFRQNIRSLPFDQRSVVLRTLWEKDFQPRASDDWQYNIQQGLQFQQMLAHPNTRAVYSLNPWMILAQEWGLTLIDVPVL